MTAHIRITKPDPSYQDKVRQFGFRIVPRRFIFEQPFMNCFEGATSMNAEQIAIAHRKEELALMERVTQQDGDFVIYAPDGDAEDFVLIGNDREELAKATWANEIEMMDRKPKANES